MKEKLSFEIASQIWGSFHSLKNCPQELITARCKGNRHISPEIYKRFIGTIPSSVRISQAGFVEPFGEIDARDCNYNKGADLYG
jgi:hypothetical protein